QLRTGALGVLNEDQPEQKYHSGCGWPHGVAKWVENNLDSGVLDAVGSARASLPVGGRSPLRRFSNSRPARAGRSTLRSWHYHDFREAQTIALGCDRLPCGLLHGPRLVAHPE